MADRVLVVDDDLPLRMAMADALREAGMELWQTGSGAAATHSVTSHSPDLVLLDLELPGFNGFEV